MALTEDEDSLILDDLPSDDEWVVDEETSNNRRISGLTTMDLDGVDYGEDGGEGDGKGGEDGGEGGGNGGDDGGDGGCGRGRGRGRGREGQKRKGYTFGKGKRIQLLVEEMNEEDGGEGDGDCDDGDDGTTTGCDPYFRPLDTDDPLFGFDTLT